jgi:hypothetical protein
MSLSYILAWLLPWMAGTGICLAINRGLRVRGDLAGAMGGGFLLGLFLAAGIACLIAKGDTTHAFARTAPWLTGIGVLAWVAAIALRGRRDRSETAALPQFWRVIWWLLLAAIIVRLGTLGSEALLRPTFPWDAWSAWAVKPKAWFLLDHFVPYVPMQQWLAQPDAALRTSAIWDYPELLAWIEIWFASAAGSWNEPLINLVWTGVLGAIGLASYGQWRAIGLSSCLALTLVYGLLSLPLLGAHSALAGYADIWLAATFGLAVLAWLRWIRRREPGQLLLAIVFAFCMPLIKLEGAVWLFVFSAVFVLSLLPRRWRWPIAAGALALAIGGVAFGGFLFPMLGLGWVRVTWGQVVIPALGALDLHWRPVGSAMLSGLLTLPNWHLLWYLAPVVVLLRWRVFLIDRAARALGALLGYCAVFLFVLFFFTEASAWAENYTSANRLILHIVPALFSLLAILLADVSVAIPDRDRARQQPTAAT